MNAKNLKIGSDYSYQLNSETTLEVKYVGQYGNIFDFEYREGYTRKITSLTIGNVEKQLTSLAILEIETDSDYIHSIAYTSLEELSQEAFKTINNIMEVDTTPIFCCSLWVNGIRYDWDLSHANYCFAKGRISINDFIALTFGENQ